MSLVFKMDRDVLHYDDEKSILLCKDSLNNKNRWAKKIEDINSITDVIEDSENFYVICESDERSGKFLALNKKQGTTSWYIPGRSFLQLIFGNHLYIIFIEERNIHYLIKVDKSSGKKIWYFQVDSDLKEYSFRRDRILLIYESGKMDMISPETGVKVQ